MQETELGLALVLAWELVGVAAAVFEVGVLSLAEGVGVIVEDWAALGFWDGIGFAAIGELEKAPLPMRIAPIPKAKSPRMVPIVAGEKGYRAIGKNTTIMIHQFSDSLEGKYHDMKAYAKECDRYNDKMAQILSDCSNLTVKDVKHKLLKQLKLLKLKQQKFKLLKFKLNKLLFYICVCNAN